MRSSYSEVIQQNLDEAIEYSVFLLQEDASRVIDASETGVDLKGYKGTLTGNQFKDDFVSYLTKNLNSRITGLDVNIYGADEVNGLLSVKVRAYYEYSNGKEDYVESYKTVVLNRTNTGYRPATDILDMH